MKFSALLKLTFIANIIAANFVTIPSAQASTFDEQEIAQERIIAIASPYRHGHNLVIIEQVPGKDKCWAEHGVSPVTVDPLLMNFDFTGHCRRATDSNGYSVRIGGEERGSDYLLEIVEQGNELVLIGTTRGGAAPITLGRTRGITGGANKIFLDSGWNFTKRSYQGKELSHFYFSDRVGTTVQTAATPKKTAETTKVTTTTTKTIIEETSTTQETNQLF